MDVIKEWIENQPLAVSLLKYILWVIFVLGLIQFLRRLLKKNLPSSSARYGYQKGIELAGYFILIVLTLSYFTGNIKDFTLAIGLLTAGITITLQELILSIAGSIYIFVVKVYKPGDRIEINNIKGDVIDIDSIYTTMMEIGEWVGSDNYSGRIVKLSNAFVFKGPVYNYSRDFPFIWDEFNIPVRYGSDVELAKQLIIDIARDTLSDYVAQSIAKWEHVVDKYYVENAQVDPTLAITITDNWVNLNLRYIVDYKKRRYTKHLLNEKIAQAFEGTNGRVEVASTTLEIVRIPSVERESKAPDVKDS